MSFINPIENGYLTSPFGYRTHPVTGAKGSFHQGVDIARQPNVDVRIMASADGEVIRVGALGTYGNIVMIKHIINGKRMDTNYAHLKHSNVIVGQKVKQGQVIGVMGNTGSSTAPHLHFEIHNGAWLKDQPNATDPEKYIKLYTKKELSDMEKEIKALKAEVDELKSVLSEIKSKLPPTYYKDADPSLFAKDAVKWAKNKKPTAITDGTYLKRPITREETITMLYRANQKGE